MVRCPGQDQRFWKPEDIFEVNCPGCNKSVEFFKDEPKLKCRNCGQVVANPKIDLGCAQWCQYAEQCLSVSVKDEANVMRERLIREMMNVFGADQSRINHTLAVLDYAEQILLAQGGDPLVTKAAAILHDIGIGEAERKHGSSAGKYQEIEGLPIAKNILKKYDLDDALIDRICEIVANHHSAKDINTPEFKIVWDADWLVNIPEEFAEIDKEKLRKLIDKTFKTKQGRQIAVKLFLETKDN